MSKRGAKHQRNQNRRDRPHKAAPPKHKAPPPKHKAPPNHKAAPPNHKTPPDPRPEYIPVAEIDNLGEAKRNYRQELILEALAFGASRTEAAKAAGIARQSFYNWMHTDELFRESVGDAEDEALDAVRAVAHQCALKAADDPRYQPTLRFVLKCRAGWTEKPESREQKDEKKEPEKPKHVPRYGPLPDLTDGAESPHQWRSRFYHRIREVLLNAVAWEFGDDAVITTSRAPIRTASLKEFIREIPEYIRLNPTPPGKLGPYYGPPVEGWPPPAGLIPQPG